MKRISLMAIAIVFTLMMSVMTSCHRKDDDNNQTQDDTNHLDLPAGIVESDVTNTYDLVFGGSGNNDDELASGMVADGSGNIYVSMNVTNTQANKNIIIIRVNSDGSLGWAKQYDYGNELSPDSGENGETGGTAGSISMDASGDIYVVGETSTDEIGYAMLILKLDPSDGSVIWQKLWKPEWPEEGHYPTADQDAHGYAIDAHGDYVYVTGSCGTNAVEVIALNQDDGSIVFQKSLDIVSGTLDRGYAIKEDASGNLYLGGVDGSYAWIAKLSNANTANPDLDWVKYAGLSYGARINDIDVDGSDVYYSCDIRGVETKFMILKANSSGTLQWAKYFGEATDNTNNTHVVYVSGDYLWAGGRIGISGLDLMGDALLAKIDKSNGNLVWAGVYYTGRDSEHSTEQRIKGIAVVGSNVYIAGQIYPSSNNFEVYSGEWLEGSDFGMNDASVSFSDITSYEWGDFTGEIRDADGSITNYTVGKLQSSSDKTTDNAPDADAFMMKLKF